MFRSRVSWLSGTLFMLVDFRQHRLGQIDENWIATEFLPRQILKLLTLEKQVGVGNKNVLQ